MKTKAVTLGDIAQKAGVSITTVSHVINKTRQVNQETRENVLRILEEMNYQVNPSQGKKGGVPSLLGVIVADIHEDYYVSLIKAVETIANEHDISLAFFDSEDNPDKEKRNIGNILRMGVEGLIIAPVQYAPYPKELRTSDIPVILVDRQYTDHDTLFVGINNFESASLATGYLLDRGCRKIGFIGYADSVYSVRQRILGYKARVYEALPDYSPKALELKYENEDSYKLIKDFIVRNGFDGLICATSDICYETIAVVEDLGLPIPDSLKIVTYDDNKWLDYLKYPISVITQPTGEIANYAVERIIRLVRSPHGYRRIKSEMSFDVQILDRLQQPPGPASSR